MENKLKDTKAGEWLKQKAPHIMGAFKDSFANDGVLGFIKNLVDADSSLSPADKLEFERIKADMEINAQNNVTKRWEADMKSDVFIAKIIRPAIMITLLLFFMMVTVWDAVDATFITRESYIDLLEVLMITVFGAYFAGRSIEKIKR